MRAKRQTWIVRSGLAFVLMCGFTATLSAAVVIRSYPFGEDDPGATIGETTFESLDIVEAPDDGGGSLVPLAVEFGFDDEAPTYVEGRDGAGSFALDFDGLGDRLVAPAFDPRNFAGSFTALSQAWLKPDPMGMGFEQAVWSLGNDNGGVGISDDGFWQFIASSGIADTKSPTPVAFDEWTHLAVFRTGNNSTLYINGSVAVSGAGFWNGVGDVTVGNRTSSGGDFLISYNGAVDDFKISGFSDFSFNPADDIDFFSDLVVTGVLGDVDQDGDADMDDYDIWAANVGFDNGFGTGDPATLLMGDLDQNGRINYFDFSEIVQAAAAAGTPLAVGVPEPSSLALLAGTFIMGGLLVMRRRRVSIVAPALSAITSLSLLAAPAAAELLVAEDFLYSQPTKELGPGGGFQLQDYGGGQNGPLSAWDGRWVSIGNGIITGSDIMDPDYNPETDQFQGHTRGGLSSNQLDRDFTVDGLGGIDTLYFGIQMRTGAPDQLPRAHFRINPPGADENDNNEIGIGFAEGTSWIQLGDQDFPGFDPVNDAMFHNLIGKLEVNANGDNERLSVWVDPTGVEMAADTYSVENDIIADLSDLAGTLQLWLDPTASSQVFWDDLAVGTTWEDVATVDVPRLTLKVDPEDGDVAIFNETNVPADLNYYEINSEGGWLLERNWESLESQGGGWLTSSDTRNLFLESNFANIASLQPGDALSLGSPFAPGRDQDLIARAAGSDGLLNLMDIEYGPFDLPVDEGIPGDYNNSGQVEQADLDLVLLNWGDTIADPESLGWTNDLPDGQIDQGELDGVLLNWGNTASLAANAVPEPSGWLLLVIGCTALVGRRRR